MCVGSSVCVSVQKDVLGERGAVGRKLVELDCLGLNLASANKGCGP